MMIIRPLTALCRRHGKTLTWLSNAIGRPRHTVKKWGVEVDLPPKEISSIVAAFGGDVTPSDLRPDLYSPSREACPGACHTEEMPA